MIDYGNGPEDDEIEVSLFGPGYGEAIAIHLGEASWLLVDSCLDPDTKAPVTAQYLDYINVQAEQVKSIVASHWHDDHVRGISELSTKYSDADFVLSGVFTDNDALAFLLAYNGLESKGLGRGAKELYKAIEQKESPAFALHKSIILDQPLMVTALSPLPATYAQSVAHFTQYLPKANSPINNAPQLKPNLESVVLHIDLGDDAILLGSDLEENQGQGWSAIVADKWSSTRTNASLYKVAHHGSISGECADVWTTLLKANPISSMTPWTLAGNKLPTDDDKARVKATSSQTYLSSVATKKPKMEHQTLKRLEDIASNIINLDSGLGVIRLRKKPSESDWRVELFGAASLI